MLVKQFQCFLLKLYTRFIYTFFIFNISLLSFHLSHTTTNFVDPEVFLPPPTSNGSINCDWLVKYYFDSMPNGISLSPCSHNFEKIIHCHYHNHPKTQIPLVIKLLDRRK